MPTRRAKRSKLNLMAVSTAAIKKLREETEAPVMEVKHALEGAKGDAAKAKDILREKAVMRAEKKKERDAGAGMIFSYIHQGGSVGVLLDLHCETDFVARTDNFQNLGKELMLQIAAMDPEGLEELMDQEYIRDPKRKVKDYVAEVSG